MQSLVNVMRTLWKDESGQDMAEYALLLVLISVIVAGAVLLFRNAITEGFNRATEELENSTGS